MCPSVSWSKYSFVLTATVICARGQVDTTELSRVLKICSMLDTSRNVLTKSKQNQSKLKRERPVLVYCTVRSLDLADDIVVQ